MADRSTTLDWSAIERDILCPLCDYNLRGLGECRCPECGYKFTWDRLHAELPTHPWLFEHHAERNARSFFRTLGEGLRPGKFWRSVQPTDRPVPARLVGYWIFATSLIALGVLQPFIIPWSGHMDLIFDPDAWMRVIREGLFLIDFRLLFVIVLWPWLTIAALTIFKVSLGRALIKPIHVNRCALYCGDGALWVLMLTLAIYFEFGTSMPSPYKWTLRESLMSLIATAVLFVFTSYRLSMACKHYLRIDRPVAVAISTQGIVLLIVLIALI